MRLSIRSGKRGAVFALDDIHRSDAMDVGQIQSGLVGMALFDMWADAVAKSHNSKPAEGSPLVAAAAAAFEQYIGAVETQMGAQILGLTSYALNPGGNGATLLTGSDLAPFLALNVMA
jgi:hypothetical protein